MIHYNDFIFAAVGGFIISILIFTMLFIQINNAKKNIIDKRVYMLSWFSSLPALISFIFLVKKIKVYDSYILFVIIGTVIYLLLTIIIYFVLLYYDRSYLKKLYNDNIEYSGVPNYMLLITGLDSSLSFSVVLGWLCLSIVTGL